MKNQGFDDDEMLKTWEEVYKKGLLSFWILMLLSKRPSYPFEMNPLIEQISHETISADENSLYRALSRFENMGIVQSELKPSPHGPSRRYYQITTSGKRLLARFIQRNLLIYQDREMIQIFNSLLDDTSKEINHDC